MILSGKEMATQIQDSLKQELSLLKKRRPPKLSVILVGKNNASQIYVTMKERACHHIGITSTTHLFEDDVQESALLTLIHTLNHDPSVDGILIQLPLPPHINSQRLFESVDPQKDVDGFHPINMGKLLLGQRDGLIPCTPLAVQKILLLGKIPIEGKHVVIVGRSNIVGKPLGALLCQKEEGANATVTLCHSKSQNIAALTKEADILIAACGAPQFITASMVKEKAVVIDVGIHRIVKNNKAILVGDVDFTEVQHKASYITPVPGGVGPMTVTMLLYNTIKSYKCAI